MNRIESYLLGANAAETPQQLLESMAKLFEGTTPKERELLAIQLDLPLLRQCGLSEEEQRSMEVMLEQWKKGEPVAVVGVHLLMLRVIMEGIGDFLNTRPHFGS